MNKVYDKLIFAELPVLEISLNDCSLRSSSSGNFHLTTIWKWERFVRNECHGIGSFLTWTPLNLRRVRVVNHWRLIFANLFQVDIFLWAFFNIHPKKGQRILPKESVLYTISHILGKAEMHFKRKFTFANVIFTGKVIIFILFFVRANTFL